jgi:hypothetical protein
MTPLRFLLPLLPALVLPAHAAGEEPAALLKLTNGNRLSGIPTMINDEGQLVLKKSGNLAAPGAFKVSSLLDVRLPKSDHQPPRGGHQAVLTLTNGDTVRGQLSALDHEHITLDSWYGGTLKIRRSMANGLEVLQSEKNFYSGPDSLDGWTVNGDEEAWSFRNGSFVTPGNGNGGIAREFDLPDKVHFSFQISWRDSFKFRAFLFASEGDNETPENCYDLVCQRSFVYLRKRWVTENSSGNENIGRPASIRELAQNEKVQLDLYIDRKTGNFTFLVDGKQAQVWTDPNPEAGNMGNWLHLVSEDDPLRITRIEASTWAGELPNDPSSEPADPPLEEEGQVIRLHNGDDLVGEVDGIEEGVLTLKTKQVDNIQVPVDRMRTIDLTLGDDEREEPRLMKGDIRAWLRDGGCITFQLKSFSEDKLTGYSQTFGTAEFNLNAFSRLEFNIHNEDLEPLRDDDSW